MPTEFFIPKIIETQYQQLYDLVEHSKNGLLNFRDVAAFLGKDPQWLLRTTYNGRCPFAFGSDVGVNRGSVCFHALPFFNFMTQGAIFNQEVSDQLVRR